MNIKINLLIFFSLALACWPAFSQKLYFAENGAQSISRTATDGSNLELMSKSGPLGDIRDIEIDEVTNTVYWIENNAFFAMVKRAPLTSFGGVVQLDVAQEFVRVAAPANQFEGLSIDPINRMLFITNFAAGSIIKISLDATPTIINISPFTLYSGLIQTFGIDVDPVNAKFYFVNQATTRQIQIANTSGGALSVILNVSGVYGQIHDVAVDPTGGSIYFTTLLSGQGRIFKADLDGNNPIEIVSGLSTSLKGLTVDSKNGFVYWAEGTAIGRSNLDGSGTSPIVSGRNVANYVTIDFSLSIPPKLYWAEGNIQEIHRINTIGNDFERYYSSIGEGPSYNPTGMALDVIKRQLYWTDQDLGTVRRGLIGETGFESVETLLDFADYSGGTHGIDLDAANGQMYYANGIAGQIQRADFDAAMPTTTVTTIVTIANPFGVDVDLTNGKIYYTANDFASPNNGTLYRANLDGTGQEILSIETTSGISPERYIHDVKVDPLNGKVYWVFTESDGPGTIFQANVANVSGTKTSLIASTSGEVRGIEIDPESDRIWWVSRGISSTVPPAIVEARLSDGGNVTNIHQISFLPPNANFIVLDKGCQAPLALDISINAPLGQTTNANPVSSSVNPGDVITITLTQSPTKGTATVQSDNTINYTPNTGTIGTDAVTYEICNLCGLCDQGVITISIPNVPPVIASAGSIEVTAGNLITIPVAGLLSDANNNLDITTLSVTALPTSGANASFNSNNELEVNYAGVTFSGTDNLTIQVCDLSGACATRIISITVNPAPAPSPTTIIVYNGLSPNGDSFNSYFRIENIEFYQPNTVKIYNRWGDKVFEINNYTNSDPTRRFNGISDDVKELPNGIYFYRIESGVGQNSLEGYLTLKR